MKKKLKPSERIEKRYAEYFNRIMRTRNDSDASRFETSQIHSAIAEIAIILDELYEQSKNPLKVDFYEKK